MSVDVMGGELASQGVVTQVVCSREGAVGAFV